MESGPIAPPEPAPPFVGIEESTGTISVNGFEFNKDDHRSALLSEAELDKPITPLKPGFRPIAPDEYKTYLDNIDKPSLSRLAKKNFGIGIDVGQLLAGNVLKFASFGNETINELGDSVVKKQIKDLAFNEPYQRAFTEGATNSPREAGEWFVANAAQMAPLMMEMVLAAFVGGVAGAATGGTGIVGGTLGATGRFLARRAGREKLAKLAKKAMEKQRKAKSLGQKVDLDPDELQALRSVSRYGGALAAGTAASYGVGIGDIYGEMEESGTSDRLLAAVLALGYAGAEIAPAAFAATTLVKAAVRGGPLGLKAAGRAALGSKEGGRLRRAVGGTVGGGVLEGGTEVFQDILTLYGAGKLNFDDPEVQDQLTNAFAAGAGVGAPIGGISAAYGKSAPKPKEINDDNTPTSILGEDEEVLPPGPEDGAEGFSPLQGELFSTNLGQDPSALSRGVLDRELTGERADVLSERNSLLDEQDRLQRQYDDLTEDFRNEAQRENPNAIKLTRLRNQLRRIPQALAELDVRLGTINTATGEVVGPSEEFAGVPGRSAALAERLGKQATLPFAVPVDTEADSVNLLEPEEAEVGPQEPDIQPDLFGGLPPEETEFIPQAQEDALFAPLEAQQNIPPVFPEGQTQGELNVEAPVIDQPIPAGFPPVGTSTSYIQSTPQSYDVTPSEPVRSPDGTIVREPDGTIVEVDQRQPTPVRPPGVNISEIAAAPFVPEGAERSRRFAEDFELAVAERDEQSRPQFIKGEEAIFDETTQTLVPVRQLLSKSEKRIDALDQLYNCLKKG
jgi:hypothetical protein